MGQNLALLSNRPSLVFLYLTSRAARLGPASPLASFLFSDFLSPVQLILACPVYFTERSLAQLAPTIDVVLDTKPTQ
jgi:hypothetical protein